MSNAQTLYDTLFATLQGLQNNTVTIEQAQARSEVAQTIINVAKVEVDYAKATSAKTSTFFTEQPKQIAASNAPKQQFDDIAKPIALETYKTAHGSKVEVIGNLTRHTSK